MFYLYLIPLFCLQVGMLSKLQQSVEKEEGKWLQKVAEAEEKTAEVSWF